ncbi:MAG: type II secretion system protein [Magnetococcales bacterium]|nr:type II secretion system protein [Magnetococcales bacterium]
MEISPSGGSQRGFTLTQMAVVILLAGILLTMGMTTMKALQDNTALSVTHKRLEIIQQALQTYLNQNPSQNRLPCPDQIESVDGSTPLDGVENLKNGTEADQGCLADQGVLPYVTLGLQKRTVLDGWDRYFTYHLDDSANSAWGTARPQQSDFSRSGSLTVIRRDHNGRESGSRRDAVLVVVSHGPNGFGGYSIKGTRNVTRPGVDLDENENHDGDDRFVERDHNEQAGYTDSDGTVRGEFDDILLVMGRSNLLLESRQPSQSFTEIAQADLKILDEAAHRFNGYLITYVDNFPQTTPAGDGELQGDGRLGDLWDRQEREVSAEGGKKRQNHFLDPFNVAAPNIDPRIGYHFLDQNQQGGESGESALAVLTGKTTQRPFIAAGFANDPWGEAYLWDEKQGRFFSRGPDRQCQGGDDVSSSMTATSMGGDSRCTGAN